MKETSNASTITKSIFKKYNTTMFTVAIVGALTYCILSLTSISQIPLENTTTSSDAFPVVTFNVVSVNRLNNMVVNDSNPGNQVLPTGRINPFSE